MSTRKRLFGTDGIRGVANVEPMTADTTLRLGRAIAHIFKKEPRRHRILIGKDTRLSGYIFEYALTAGICSMGVDVLLAGPIPTPAIAFLTSSMRADAGVVISASHNPYQDNGIKLFSSDGFKLPDELELEIEGFVLDEDGKPELRPSADEVGKAYRIDDAVGRYVVFVKNTFPKELTLDGLKIVVDCANGATYRAAPEAFYELGAEVVSLGVSPNGVNINKGCGSLHPEGLKEEVLRQNAHLGIAFDGDGDRCILVDEKGNIVNGDHILAICATAMIKEGTLKDNTVVATVMSNTGLDEAVERAGGRVVRTQVGDRYVVEEMLRGGYNLGGEQSGHIVFFEHTTTGDGIITAMQILSIMIKEGKPLSELASIMTYYPQVLVNVRVREKRPLDDIPSVRQALRDIENSLGGRGRVFVRYSGTEPVARVTVEGEKEDVIKALAQQLADVIKKELG